jgi:hypothetical protein
LENIFNQPKGLTYKYLPDIDGKHLNMYLNGTNRRDIRANTPMGLDRDTSFYEDIRAIAPMGLDRDTSFYEDARANAPMELDKILHSTKMPGLTHL